MGLRVIDAGPVEPGRSQALWHGIATAMDDDRADPVLSLCRPVSPYVGIGYHRRLDELDLDACAADGLPVLRRQIGGGPVYLDGEQLFFGLTLPPGRAPAAVDRLYREILAPAVTAFARLGVRARLDGLNDIVCGERKLSGTGAGRIGPAVTVVGNVIRRFPHERMARVLALPSERMRAECLRLMRRHVSCLETEACAATLEDAGAALREAYAEAFGPAAGDTLRPAEERAVARWEARLADPAWTQGPELPQPPVRQVKIRAGVWVVHGTRDGTEVLASFSGDRVERAEIRDPALNGTAAAAARALVGCPPDATGMRARLSAFGPAGERVVAALEPGLVLR